MEGGREGPRGWQRKELNEKVSFFPYILEVFQPGSEHSFDLTSAGRCGVCTAICLGFKSSRLQESSRDVDRVQLLPEPAPSISE
jgi:hypothetical protein